MTLGREGGDTVGTSPNEAFTLLGNETRMDILQALWTAYDPYAFDNAVPFSDLYERVDIDDTGNFNYHLGELTDHFVRQTGDGYELAAPGFEVVHAVVAGTTTEDPTLAPTQASVSCMRCGSPVEIAYEEGISWVLCTECDGYWAPDESVILGLPLPPGGLRNRTPDGILEATIAYALHRFEMMDDGVCPACGGTVSGSLVVCEEHDAGDGVCDVCESHFLGIITYVCDSCKNSLPAPSWAPVQRHPELVAFYREHGIEHRHNSWEAVSRGYRWPEALHATDPPRVRVTVTQGDDELVATLDETGTVVDVDW